MKTKLMLLVAGVALMYASPALACYGCEGCGLGYEEEGSVMAPEQVKEAPVVKEATIGTDALRVLLNAKTPVVLLDARSGKYDDGKRIPGAMSLNAESAEEAVNKLIPNKEALVVTYCGSLTCGASHKLAERLAKLGYKNVVEYPEGIAGWVKAGNKVEEVKK